MTRADRGSGPGLLEGLKLLGGLVMAVEGFSIAAHAASIGQGVVAVLGIGTVSGGTALLIGVALFGG